MSARLSPGSRGLLVALGLLFLASRLFHLTGLPPFRDESAHIFWSVHLLDEPGLARAMADGKLLEVLLMALVVPWASDPLWGGRLVSVLAGGLGLWCGHALGRRLYDERVGFVAAVLYLFCPFALFHDRMALADVFLSSFAALSLLASLALLEAPSAASGVRLGLALSASILSKVPGLMVLGAPPLAALLVGPRAPRRWRALAVALAVALLLVAGPVGYFFTHTTQLQAKGVAVGEGPAFSGQIAENLGLVCGWLWAYLTPPILLAAVAGALVGLVRRDGADLFLALCAAGPPAVFVLLAASWFPRYVLLATVPALVLAARLLCRVARTGALASVLVLVASLPALRFDATLLLDPARAPLPAVDRFQYVDGWPSGYGSIDAIPLLRRELDAHPAGIGVLTGTIGQGTVYFVLRTAFLNEPRVHLEEVDLWDPETHAAVGRAAAERPTFLIPCWSNPARARALPPSAAFVAAPMVTLRKPSGVAVGEIYRAFPLGS